MPKNRKKSSKNDNSNSKSVFFISFITTFIIAIFIIGLGLNYFSPTVDVNIGQNDILPEENESVSNIDDRLKWIQDEDNASKEPTAEKYLQNENEFNKSFKQEMIRPKKHIKKTEKNERPEEIPLPVNTKYITVPPVPTINEVQNTSKQQTNPNIKITKVYIGFYNSSEEAQDAKAKISQTVPGIQPFVKAVNGQYIVQAGSFSDRKKAVELRDTLNSRGYTARLLSD